MQTILGAGGAIGIELAKALTTYTTEIRLVSRHPKKVNDTDQLHPADLTDALQIEKAIQGSEVCYLLVGFDYKIKVWQQQWPELIKNVVSSCIKHQCRLVMFDNVYAIGDDNVKHITEDSPISPSSKKGEVRAIVDRYILENVEKGKLAAIIARSPDFFGPTKKNNSALMTMVYDNLLKNTAAQWFCNADVKHSMGFTPDLANGTALLGNTSTAYNQIWNLPVDSKAPTGREWVAMFASAMNKPDKVKVFPKWAVKGLGLFIPILREMYEMLYQYDRDYVFDSSKFKKEFDYSATSNEVAVKLTVKKLR